MILDSKKGRPFGEIKAGLHKSHFIAFHRISSHFIAMYQMSITAIVKWCENRVLIHRNSSYFIIENKIFCFTGISFNELRWTAMNWEEWESIRIHFSVYFHTSKIILIDRRPNITVKYDKVRWNTIKCGEMRYMKASRYGQTIPHTHWLTVLQTAMHVSLTNSMQLK